MEIRKNTKSDVAFNESESEFDTESKESARGWLSTKTLTKLKLLAEVALSLGGSLILYI